MITFIKAALFFILASLCEIGGDYLVWLWFKKKKTLGMDLPVELQLLFKSLS